jgi:DGQHR domain-containing protein
MIDKTITEPPIICHKTSGGIKMARKKIDVIPIRQDGHTLLLAAMTANDLLSFTDIDRFRASLPTTDPNQGYQRPEEIARAKKVAKYVSQPDPLMPTAVLLNARDNSSNYDVADCKFTLDDAIKLQVMDGQHRRAGLRYAIKEMGKTDLQDYQLPVVITLGLSKVEEMMQFRTVNGTQKSVRTDLVNMILSHIASEQGEDEIPDTEIWKIVVARATERLNANEDSVWYDMIIMPDETGYTKKQIAEDPDRANRKIVRATSFMQSLKPIYTFLFDIAEDSVADADTRAAQLADVVAEYWNAISELCPVPFESPKDYVIQKTPGVFALHMAGRRLLVRMFAGHRAFVQQQFEEMLQIAANNDDALVFDEAFWRAAGGRAADFGSMKGFTELAGIIEADFRVDRPLA